MGGSILHVKVNGNFFVQEFPEHIDFLVKNVYIKKLQKPKIYVISKSTNVNHTSISSVQHVNFQSYMILTFMLLT